MNIVIANILIVSAVKLLELIVSLPYFVRLFYSELFLCVVNANRLQDDIDFR